MESTSSVQQLRRPARHKDKVRQVVIAGLVLVAILAALSILNPLIGVFGSLLVLLLAIFIPRPMLIVYGLTLALPLTGGLARGAAIPVLRVGQALLVLGFIIFMLAKPGRLGKYGLTLALPLTGGLARGAAIPVLRVGQALLVLGFIIFMLAKPGRLGKYRL